jgi:hypothetical protein
MSISEAVYTVGKAALNNVVQVEIKKDAALTSPLSEEKTAENLSAFTDAGARAVIDATWGLLMKQQKGLA